MIDPLESPGEPASKPPRAAAARRGTARRELWLLLLLLLVPRLGFLAVTPAQLGSVDLRSWEYVTAYLLEGGNPYAASREKPEELRSGAAGKLNWPPFWLQILFGLAQLAALTGAALALWIKLFLVGVEAALVCILYLFVRRCLHVERAFWILAVGICLNPAAMLQTVVHCNFDVLVACFILAFLYAFCRFSETRNESLWLLAALFLGLAIQLKTFPVALAPLLTFGWSRLSRAARGIGLFLLLAPAAIGVSLLYVLSPGPVGDYVLGYRSIGGFYGVSGLLGMFGLQSQLGTARVVFQLAVAAGLVAVGRFAVRRESLSPRESLVLATLILVALPTFGPGYGPQYLYWYLPLLCAYFAVTGPANRSLLLGLFAIVVLTYGVEYALLRSHGQLYRIFVPGADLRALGASLGEPANQTLLRLPQFVAAIALLVRLGMDLRTGRAASA